MLTQYHLTLSADHPCRPRPEWGYRLYAALLETAPASFGLNVHQDAVTPVSQYFTMEGDVLRWNITLLGRECQECLGAILWERQSFFLQNGGILLQVLDRNAKIVSSVEEFLSWSEDCTGCHRLIFQTTTAFKSRGQYLNLPTSRLIIQSLIKKWNGCFPDCPIEDEDGQGMDALAAGIRCERFRLRDSTFSLKGNAIPGFAGTLVLRNHLLGYWQIRC